MAEEGRRTYAESPAVRQEIDDLGASPTCPEAHEALVRIWDAVAMLERVSSPGGHFLPKARAHLDEALYFFTLALRYGECREGGRHAD